MSKPFVPAIPVKVALALAVSCTLALTGCGTVGRNFTAPATAGVPSYRHVGDQTVPAQPGDSARLPAQWWTVFNDTTLNTLETRALQDSPGVRAAAQRLLQAQAQLGVVRANQRPKLSVGASVANSRSSAESAQGQALGGQAIKGMDYQVGTQFSYELDLWGRVRRVVETADAQALAAQDDRDGVLLMLSSQVASTYWQLRGMDAEMAILKTALATRLESNQLVEARFNAGLSNELDVARTRIERANAEADLHEVQRARNNLEHALSTLVGTTPTAPLLATNEAALPVPPVIPVGLPASLLSQRPDLAASVANLKAANAQIGVAEGAFYPALSLTGSFGFASENLRTLSQGSARQFSAGPLSLSLPIFDGGRNKANLALARARYDEAVANHEERLLTALREVEDALSDVQERSKQGAVQVFAQKAAARALVVAQARFERGVSTYLDVTDAQRSSLAADRAAAQIRTQRLLAAVAVARALGAGWSEGAPLATMAAK